MNNLRQLSAWPFTSSDLAKIKGALDSILEEAAIESDTKPGQRVARSLLSAYASGVTDSQDLVTYGRVVAKAETLRWDKTSDIEAAGTSLY